MRRNLAVLLDLLLGYFAFEVCQFLPNRATGFIEMLLFIYPQTLGFILLATVVLRIVFSITVGRSFGGILLGLEGKERTTKEWIHVYRMEVLIGGTLFMLMTIGLADGLFGFIGITLPVEQFAFVQVYITMSCFLLVTAFLAYLIFWTPIRNTKVMSNKSVVTTPEATPPTS